MSDPATADRRADVVERPARPERRGLALLRRNAAPLMVAFGAFLLTSALLLRLYVYDQLAMLPPRIDTRLRLVDGSATYLDTGTWKTVEDTEVVRRTEIRGEPSPGQPGWSAWEMSVDTASDATMVGHTDRRVVVDRSTGMAVNCCGEHVDGDRAVRQAGLVLHWPADAPAREYPFYDADIRAAPAMVPRGRDEVAGVPVVRYTQGFEATQVPDSARPVPARALGRDRSGTVTATRWVQLRRTFWVEPVSGRVVSIAEERTETLRAETGSGKRVLLDATFELADTQVAALAEEARNRRLLLTLTNTWLPIGLGATGAVVTLLAIAAWTRNGRTPEPDDPPPPTPRRS